jgi:hypothetical protein
VRPSSEPTFEMFSPLRNENDKRLVVIPYRNREAHLAKLIPKLLSRGLENILVVEQTPGAPFNKGRTLNVGVLLAPTGSFIILHDVDFYPISADYSEGNLKEAVHISTKIQQFGWKLPFHQYFGGAIGLWKSDFESCWGFSNGYWSWGCEDDDFLGRVSSSNIGIVRRKGIFTSDNHPRDEENYRENRIRYVTRWGQNCKDDGMFNTPYVIESAEMTGNGYSHVVVSFPDRHT